MRAKNHPERMQKAVTYSVRVLTEISNIKLAQLAELTKSLYDLPHPISP